MATFEKGILAGFSGKVGTVIGSNWKGIVYMRSKSNKRKFIPSQKQLEAQLKFAVIAQFLQPMSKLLEISFHDFAVQKRAPTAHLLITTGKQSPEVFPIMPLIMQKH